MNCLSESTFFSATIGDSVIFCLLNSIGLPLLIYHLIKNLKNLFALSFFSVPFSVPTIESNICSLLLSIYWCRAVLHAIEMLSLGINQIHNFCQKQFIMRSHSKSICIEDGHILSRHYIIIIQCNMQTQSSKTQLIYVPKKKKKTKGKSRASTIRHHFTCNRRQHFFLSPLDKELTLRLTPRE